MRFYTQQHTHTSYNDFEIVAANVLDHDARKVSDRIATYGLITYWPCLASTIFEANQDSHSHR